MSQKNTEHQSHDWAIEINQLFQHFNHHCILSNINLQLKKGEVLALIGSNGSGKSQLLRIIAGLTSASSGQVKVFNNPIKVSKFGYKINYHQSKVNMIFQTGSLLGDMTVLDNLLLPLRNSRLSVADMYQKARLLMTRLQLDGYENHVINSLAKGLQRKIEFARAIINEPDVLLIDEIEDSMDKKARNEIVKFLQQQKQQGTTLMIVTHEPILFHTIIDRMVLIADGKLLFLGSINELLQARKSNYELNFLTQEYQL
jgi:ABC-type multidrug transport system ATPase subunit